ncbi:hypothetical protein D3C72_1924890 [compost metagenome]
MIVTDIGGVDREPFGEFLAGHARGVGQFLQMRPWQFGIDMVRCHRRHAAPVVDPGADQLFQATRAEIGGRLNGHRRIEDQTGNGNGPEVILQ